MSARNNYEPGRYTALVIQQGFGVERSGTEFFFLTVRPLKRVFDDYAEDAQYEGDRDVKLHLTEKTIDFQLAILRDLGWGGIDFDELYSGTHSFVGQEIQTTCDVREYKGNYYDQFSIYRASSKEASGSAVSALTRKFAEKLNATAKELPLRSISLEEAAKVAAATNPGTEIPF